MTRPTTPLATLLALALAAPAAATPPAAIDIPATPAIAQEKDPTSVLDVPVRATVVPGTAPLPLMPHTAPPPPEHGDISLAFPAADVHAVAQAVLGDLLHRDFTVAQGAAGTVSLVTPYPVSKSAVLGLFEAALARSGLALAPVAGGFEIEPVAAARGLIAPDAVGTGSEVVRLQFVSPDEMRKLVDSVLPGVVTASDPASGGLTITGTSGQRASARELVRQFDVNWLRNTSFALYIPERTDARLIVPSLDRLINAPDSPTHGLVRLIAMDELNGILAISTQPQYLDDVRRWIEILDREGESNEKRIFVYRVQNGRARDLIKTIDAAFGMGGGMSGDGAGNDPFAANANGDAGAPPPADNGGPPPPRPGEPRGAAARTGAAAANSGVPQAHVTADEVNNAIIVFGTAREYAVIEDALRKLDIPPKQILIEAAITEVTLTDDTSYGVQWNYSDSTGTNSVGYLGAGSTAPGLGAVPAATALSGFSYAYLGSNIAATLNALQTHSKVKVVSAPKILVLNNQTASLQVGDQVPTTSGNTSNANGTSTSITYLNTGIILKITPRVNARGVVQLDVSQEVSNVSGGGKTTAEQVSPTISTRRIATTVAVGDGQVIALGGLFSDTKTVNRNGIPVLSQIPVLGGLFGSRSINDTRTELIVLLKPHVIESNEEARSVTEELARKLRQMAPFRSPGGIP